MALMLGSSFDISATTIDGTATDVSLYSTFEAYVALQLKLTKIQVNMVLLLHSMKYLQCFAGDVDIFGTTGKSRATQKSS